MVVNELSGVIVNMVVNELYRWCIGFHPFLYATKNNENIPILNYLNRFMLKRLPIEIEISLFLNRDISI